MRLFTYYFFLLTFLDHVYQEQMLLSRTAD